MSSLEFVPVARGTSVVDMVFRVLLKRVARSGSKFEAQAHQIVVFVAQ